MNDVTKDLLEALRDLIDSHWLHDSHAVDFDGTVLFSPSYEFSNLHCHRRSELRMDGFECVVWPGGHPDYLWSAYSTYDGSMWFEEFASEDTARAVCMEFLAAVMPEHSVSKAMAAIARAEAALAEPQPDADGWIPWAGGECPVLNMSRVDVVHRNGDIFSDGFAGYAQAKTWTHDNHPRHIIAYRIVRK